MKWQRIPRDGFIANHWIGYLGEREVCSIWRSPRGKYHKSAGVTLRWHDRRSSEGYLNLTEAKRAAEQQAV